MTVAELIRKLSVMPLTAEVVYVTDAVDHPVSAVELYSDRLVVELSP